MKNLLRKLHIGSSHDELSEGSRSSTGKSQEGSFLQKLHIGGSHDDLTEGSRSSGGRSQEGSLLNLRRLSFSETGSSSAGDQKPFSGLSGWLTSVARHTLSTSSANVSASQGFSGGSPKHRTDAMGENPGEDRTDVAGSNAGTSNIPKADPPVIRVVNSVGVEEGKVDTGAVIAAEEKVGYQVLSMDEDYQIQLAMALSVNDDPEAVQIETVKQISLGSCPSSQNTPAEVVAYRYWNYNVLNYDDKVVDGFYDVYGVVSDSSSETMPSLVDLQGTPVSGNIIWEVILVNRATDPDLVNLEQRALTLAVNSRISAIGLPRNDFIQKIADLVVQHMGGKVADADDVLKRWRTSSEALRSTLQNIVLPVGCLHVGLARHRALLFKVLADSVGIPCRLVKGRHYTGSNEGAVNIIKVEDGREYIIDLMGAPGTLIPSDVTGSIPAGADSGLSVQSIKNNSPRFSVLSNLLQHGSIDCQNEDANRFVELLTEKNVKDVEFLPENSTGGAEEFPGVPRNVGGLATAEKLNLQEDRPSATNVQESGRSEVNVQEGKHVERYHSEPAELQLLEKPIPRAALIRPNYPFAHLRSPSWTEGIGSHAARDMKDVSQYMMHAAKENPKLAQKLHDVLAESGVVAPPNLFTEISPRQFQAQVAEEKRNMEEKDGRTETRGNSVRRKEKSSVGPGRPPVAAPKLSSETEQRVKNRPQRLNSVEGLGEKRPLDLSHTSRSTSSPQSPPIQTAATPSVPPAASVPTAVQESIPSDVIKHVPVAAAAAATAAVVASSMVAAATKSDVPDPTLEVPVAAAATATAAVVAATSAVVGRKLTISETIPDVRPENEQERGTREYDRRYEDTDGAVRSPTGSGPRGSHDGEGADNDVLVEEERVSDKSSGSISAKSDSLLDDVAEWEIPWEDIIIGERIGLGSYGEVYRGDWHGTEVSVKKFLDQDISGDALEEFRSEVRIMRRLRHPNVVLFMGAVTRSPNLSIVTEFLPRGSLYRLIHRPNNQLDERRRMRMALDVARGMNYLHSSTPVIVHRDLKSPNLLVDRNWVVKVCDFGLSRMKHNTFLSSKSTAGTPEWMAPEVLRNEPSNEKCDVYSFGVILWELATLQQPWSGMNPMQVVGAVGFQHRCLEIPDDLDPVIARIIRQCWQSDPRLRPSFAEIMAELKPLQKALVAPRAPETSRSVSVVDCAPP